MPQSHAKIVIHLTFSTKNRRPLIAKDVREDLEAYMVGIHRQHDSPSIIIGTVEDHAHILFVLSKNLSLAKMVEEVKKGSSKWIKTQGPAYGNFHWQNGYGGFSVSESNIDAARAYILNQEEHHRKMTFQEELRALFRKHGVDFDERYVWD